MALPNAAALPNETYSNNARTVTSNTTVLDTDSILNVDTNSVAITVTLKEIPTRFSTMYSLYIKDIGGYAATNNITITAPTGFKVNGQQSVIIDTNSLSCQIIITSATDYICNGLSSPVVGVQDYDTGWINLNGFGHMAAALRPQYRVINRLLQFRGTAVIPLATNDGSAVVPYVNENSYINYISNAPWTGGGTGSVQTFTVASAPYFIIGFNSSGSGSSASLIPSLPAVIGNSYRYPDNTYSVPVIIATRRVQSEGDATHGICYNVPCALFFQTNGSFYISLLNNPEDGNWSNQDKTNSLRIIGTNATASEYFADFGGLNAGNAAPSSDVIIKGISSPTYKHAISVDITDARTLGGFQLVLDGISMDISRSTPLTTIHA